MSRPTLFVSNWASARSPGMFGPGPRYTIMIAPRRWEHGDGVVSALLPLLSDLRAVQDGSIPVSEYRRRFDRRFTAPEQVAALAPGRLAALDANAQSVVVEDGSTLACSCSRADAAAGKCHRSWASVHLHAAGWDVVLDGEPYDPDAFFVLPADVDTMNAILRAKHGRVS